MHKKILLCLDRNQFENFDYTMPTDKALVSMGGNSGNNVFQYSLQTILSNPENEVQIDTRLLHNEPIEEEYYRMINSNFDCIVFSPANVIAIYAVKNAPLKCWNEHFSHINIPIYAIGLGAQSNKKFSTKYLNDIKDEITTFIKTILKNDGYIGLRGEFTAECAKKLGFVEGSDFETIGCPSMFMKGSNLNIDKKDIKEDEFKPLINGYRAWNNPDFHKYFKKYPESIFVCQEEFYRLLYNQNDLTWKEYQYLNDIENKFFNMYKDNRIKLYGTFQSWYHDIKNLGINFSFGCRIHGNVVTLLAGIPSYVDAFDSRTKELAQYFDIPYGDFELLESPDPYELYKKADFTAFNKNFKDKYAKFEQFMNQCNLHIEPAKEIKPDMSLPQKPVTTILKKEINKMKKIVFVAHEFGLFKGHGGIASYLYNICLWLLNNTPHQVTVITAFYDTECDLLSNPQFKIIKVTGNLTQQRETVYEECKNINPDYIEFAEFSAMGLRCIEARQNGEGFENTVFVTNNHSATRECWEWSNEKDFLYAPANAKQTSMEETIQMKNSDYCIAPSSFLGKYVKQRYNLDNDVMLFANPYLKELQNKQQIRERLSKSINLEQYDNSFNIVLITRFEGRKHQERLINAVIRLRKEGLNINCFLAGNTSWNTDKNEDVRLKMYEQIPAEDREGFLFFDFLNLQQQELLIAAADLSIMPSTYENQPVAMIETVLRGIPVMGSIHSGIADYTENSDLLFNPFDNDDLTNKIRNFYNKSQEEREQIKTHQYNKLIEFLNPVVSILPRFDLKRKGEIVKL